MLRALPAVCLFDTVRTTEYKHLFSTASKVYQRPAPCKTRWYHIQEATIESEVEAVERFSYSPRITAVSQHVP